MLRITVLENGRLTDYVDHNGRQLLSRMVLEKVMLEANNNLMSASLVDEIMHSPVSLTE